MCYKEHSRARWKTMEDGLEKAKPGQDRGYRTSRKEQSLAPAHGPASQHPRDTHYLSKNHTRQAPCEKWACYLTRVSFNRVQGCRHYGVVLTFPTP